MTLTKNYVSLSVKQLKQLLNDVKDDEQEIRIWVETLNKDDTVYLQGRRCCGIVDDPNDKYLCIIAGLYHEEESE